MENLKPIHFRTPLLYSSILSKESGCHIYLKLDNTQPSGSFKTRGIGHIASTLYHQKNYGPRTNFIISSGGNAGLAAAYAASVLGASCTVTVPMTCKPSVIARLESMGVKVIQGGKDWYEADLKARELMEVGGTNIYLPPFDHPLVVEGHSSLIPEISEQLVEQGEERKMTAISVSVGGGGLLAGILLGLKNGTEADKKVAVIANETHGCASLALSLKSSYSTPIPTAKLERLNSIKTICTSLGAVAVSSDCLNYSIEHPGGVTSVVSSDKVAFDNVRPFANAHAFLVEPACTASLTPVYTPSILRLALPSTVFPLEAGTSPRRFDSSVPVIIVIVCGGNTLSMENFERHEKEFKSEDRGDIKMFNGEISREEIVFKA